MRLGSTEGLDRGARKAGKSALALLLWWCASALVGVDCRELAPVPAPGARTGRASHSGNLLPGRPFLYGYSLGNLKLIPFRKAPFSHTPLELKTLLRKAFVDMAAQGELCPALLETKLQNGFVRSVHVRRGRLLTSRLTSGLAAKLLRVSGYELA